MKNSLLLFILLGLAAPGFAQSSSSTPNPQTMEPFGTLSQLHDSAKPVSAQVAFTGKEGVTRALQIRKDALLKEHVTETEALLVCISGTAVYEDEKKATYTLKPGHFVRITPKVKHWVKGVEDSQLLLIK